MKMCNEEIFHVSAADIFSVFFALNQFSANTGAVRIFLCEKNNFFFNFQVKN
jgi:hypothetical protein